MDVETLLDEIVHKRAELEILVKIDGQDKLLTIKSIDVCNYDYRSRKQLPYDLNEDDRIYAMKALVLEAG